MLPKRPGPYILTLLLILLLVVVAWMFHALTSPQIQEALVKKKGSAPKSPGTESVAPVAPLPSTPKIGTFSESGVDLELQARADSLHSTEHGADQDLQIVAGFLETYSRATGGQPIGDNADITSALTGTQYPGQKGRVFPQQHRAVKGGQLVDRWGEPLWFHPNSGNSMEIRSAGPDRQMFTQDDVVLNPSPGGLGVTPLPTEPKAP